MNGVAAGERKRRGRMGNGEVRNSTRIGERDGEGGFGGRVGQGHRGVKLVGWGRGSDGVKERLSGGVRG